MAADVAARLSASLPLAEWQQWQPLLELDKQLCRWLLLSLYRLAGDELPMTQELIANMLGGCRTLRPA